MLRAKTIFLVMLFAAVGLSCEYMLWQSRTNPDAVIILMSPVLSAVSFLESRVPVLKNLTPIQSELAVVFPATLFYFEFLGYWVGQILRENGLLKYFIFICFAAFLAVVHWQAYDYIRSLLNASLGAR